MFYGCGGALTILDKGKYNSLCCQLAFECTKCGKRTDMATSQCSKNSHEINVRVNLAMVNLGLGREAMAAISCIIGMPPPSGQSSWKKHNQNLSNVLAVSLEEQLSVAGKNLHQWLNEEKCNANKDDDEIIDIAVSFDGTWHHRGFTSSHGVDIVMSVDTGKVLDATVISKTCEICQ